MTGLALFHRDYNKTADGGKVDALMRRNAAFIRQSTTLLALALVWPHCSRRAGSAVAAAGSTSGAGGGSDAGGVFWCINYVGRRGYDRLLVPTRLTYVHAALLTTCSVRSEYDQQQRSGAGNAGAAPLHATTLDGSSSPIARPRGVHVNHVPRRLPAELWKMVGLEFLLPLCSNL